LALFAALVLCGPSQAIAEPQQQLSSTTPEINLSDAEKAWLETHRVIRIADVVHLPPVIFRGDGSAPNGMAIEYLNRIGDVLGLRFEYVSAPTWFQGLEKFKAHEIDVMPMIAENSNRRQFANFTKPYISVPFVIFTRTDVPYIGGIDKLSGRKVAVSKGSITHSILKSKHPYIRLMPSTNNLEAIAKMEQGEADAYISTVLTTARFIRKGYDSVKVSGHTPYKLELRMGVRKDWPLLIGMMQKVLDTISPEEHNLIQSKWIGALEEHETIPPYIWWTLTGIASLLVVALVIIGVFRHQLELKTVTLRERVKELSGLYNISSIFNQANLTINEALQEVVDVLPSAWHYADMTCTRITYGEHVFTSSNFQETPWCQASDIMNDGAVAGVVEVFYTAEMPQLFEGPFLQEERNLIDDVALRIGTHIERIRSRSDLESLVDARTAEINSAHTLLQKTFDSLSEAVFVIDAKTRNIIDCNQAAGDMFGYSRNEFIGNNTQFLHVNEEAYRKFGEMLFPALEKEGSFDIEYTVRRSNGRAFHSDHTVTAIREPSGEMNQLVSVVQDVSHRKHAERDLMNANWRMTLAANAAGIGMWDLDLVTNKLVWDDWMLRLYGIDPQDFSGAYEAWQSGVHPDDLAHSIDAVEKAISGEQDFNTTFRIRRPDGGIRHIKANAVVIRDDRGHPLHMIGTNYDISEEEQAKHALENALEREREYSVLQHQFVSLVSHEFRTPLTIIDSSAQRLLRHKADMGSDELIERCDKIRGAVDRMIRLIEMVLYSSSLDEGQITFSPESTDLKALIAVACDHQKDASPDHEIRIDIDELPPLVSVDRKLVNQVFQNLLSNAAKYAPDSTLIEVKGWMERDNAMVSVTDHGVGIPIDEQQALFQRFFRASNSKGIAGTGLGLNVCKQFLEMHGGTIAFESVEGKGTTFTVTLPIGGTSAT